MHSIRIHPLIPFAALALAAGSRLAAAEESLREPVHPRRNVEVFAPVSAKVVRFSIQRTTRGEPCLDELEVYGPGDPEKNLALADAGTIVRASGTLPEYRIHALRHLNDGLYGNAHSWICDAESGWVELEFPGVTPVSRIVWSRDRLGKFIDRLATDYRIEIALEPGQWQQVASSADRRPLEASGNPYPSFRAGDEGFSPGSGESAGPSGPASKEYVLETWRSARGLPANSVTAILQTPDRWLWVGTANGLARFDGVQFSAPGAAALKGLRITCLHADPDGNLWAGTDGGGLFRQVDGVFHPPARDAGLPEKAILALAGDSSGAVWAGTAGGLYSLRGGKFTRQAGGLVSRIVRNLSGDGLWLIRTRVLSRWSGGSVVAPGPALELEPSRFSALVAVASDRQGAVWFGGANEYLAKLEDNEVTTFAEGHSIFTTAVREILAASSGDVWLGTSGSGLARMRAGELLVFGTDDGLPSNSITALCEDTEGNIWAGGDDGLTRISPRRCAAITMNDGLSHSVVMSLAEDASGRLWMGTNGGGLNRWQGGRAEPFAPSYVLDNESVPALLRARNGSMWAGTLNNGLARIEEGSISFLTTTQGLPENAVTAICEDPEGGLWTGSPSGGPAYVRDSAAVQPAAVQWLKGERITAILTGEGNSMWFGTAGQGLAMLSGEILTRWTTTEGLAGNSVRTLHRSASGMLWAGTSSGLSLWRNGRFESFTAKHGLPDEMISQIMDDGAGHLWLGTNRGIVRVPLASFDDVSTGRARLLDALQLDMSDGLPALECTGGYHPAGVRLSDGKLCFGTVAGLAVIDPARFAEPSPAPPVFIEQVPPSAGVAGTESGSADSAAFRFTALAYSAPQRLRFRYRLEGLDSGWTEVGSQRSAAYEFLPPGTFRFHVQASLDGGSWGGAEVAFSIPAPWWRTPWAIGAALVAAAAAVAAAARFITRRRLKRHLREVEQKLALERERTRIARDIHDQLGANLTHIALLSADGHDSLPTAARERFMAIAASSNELVQAVDAIVWAVNPRHGSLESLARYLSRFAGDFLAAAALRLRLDVPVDLPDAELSPEMRHSIFLAAREVLNNSVRHAAATEVQLSMHVAGNGLTITIADNGRGFVPSVSTDGDGLENMRRRLAECGGTCEIASAPGHGTTVTFSIPLAVHS